MSYYKINWPNRNIGVYLFHLDTNVSFRNTQFGNTSSFGTLINTLNNIFT